MMLNIQECAGNEELGDGQEDLMRLAQSVTRLSVELKTVGSNPALAQAGD